MESRNIPSEEWVAYFDRFSRDHVGWVTGIKVLDPELGPQDVAVDLALQGISFDTKGTRPSSVDVGVGDGRAGGLHVTHVVDLPLRIREAAEGDGSVDIEIEPADGPVTLVHLRGPVQ